MKLYSAGVPSSASEACASRGQVDGDEAAEHVARTHAGRHHGRLARMVARRHQAQIVDADKLIPVGLKFRVPVTSTS